MQKPIEVDREGERDRVRQGERRLDGWLNVVDDD